MMRTLTVVLILTSVTLGCPTRINPALPDESDSDVEPIDSDLEPFDGDQVDALVDSDQIGCPPGQQRCDGICFQLSDRNHCGDCDVRCDPDIDSCRCIQGEGDHTYDCWTSTGGSAEPCEVVE